MRVARLGVVAVLTGIAAVPFALLFGGRVHLPLLGGAVLVPCAAGGGLALALPRVAGWARSTVSLVVLTLPAVVLSGAGGAVLHGPARLLTAALPLQPEGPELAVAVLAVGLTAVAGTELALSPARPALVAATPAAGCYALGLALGVSGPRPPVVLAAALVAGAGVLLAIDAAPAGGRRAAVVSGPRLVGAEPPRRRPPPPRLAAVALLVAAAAALASLLGPAAPGAAARGQPFDARDLVAAPVVPRTSVSPLSDLPVVRSGPARTLFTVHSDRRPGRLRAATLTRFDGHVWTTGGSYRRAGQVLPPAPSSSAEADSYRLRVEVADPDAVTWLPTAGRGIQVSVAGLGVDTTTGDMVVPVGQLAPEEYTVTSSAPSPDTAALRAAVAARPEQSLAQPGGLPELERLRAAVGQVAAAKDTAFEQLAALREVFRRGFAALGAGDEEDAGPREATPLLHQGPFGRSQGPGAPAGHGLSQIEKLLETGRGTAEQYASAFAVIARQLGYDARVVVGFRVPDRGQASGRYEVTNRDADAWAEVRLHEVGWVPFDPTPRGAAAGEAAADGGQDPEGSASRAVQEAAEAELADDGPGSAGDDQLPTGDGRGDGPSWRLLAGLAGMLALAPSLAAGLLPPVSAAVRRRRRRRPDPARRVAGAWREVLDRFAEHGLPVTPAMTSGEVATAGAARLQAQDTAGLADLARIVDVAGYGPDPVDDAQAVAAWRLSDRLRRSLAARVPRHRRALRVVDPRVPALRLAARQAQRVRRIEKVNRPSMK